MKEVLLAVLVLLTLNVEGQDREDLKYEEFIKIVVDHHPVAYRARLMSEMAVSTQKVARGAFDPKIEGTLDRKSFEDKNYYTMASGTLKIPLWYGIDVKAGFDRNSGQFLNDSDVIPRRGLWNVGISVPLGKGLILNRRRAELEKANILTSATEQQRILLLNELVFDASIAYLQWQVAHAQQSIAVEGVDLARIRFEAAKESFVNGDKPAIDTLESFILLQTRQVELQKAAQILDNVRILLNNYLWINGELPLEIEEGITPESVGVPQLMVEMAGIVGLAEESLPAHPNLLLYDYKNAEMSVDCRLAKEDLKPDMRLQFNPLLAVAEDALIDEVNPNNYKLGVHFSYPIRQRKERGKMDLLGQKMKDLELQKALKYQDIKAKLVVYKNNIEQSDDQLRQMRDITANYQALLEAERTKFDIGESSVFLLNSRENKYLQSRKKVVEMQEKAWSNRWKYLFASGIDLQSLGQSGEIDSIE